MTYFKIKKSADQKRRVDGSMFIVNELYTKREKEKYDIPNSYYDEIILPKNKTYTCFGARFEMEK